MSTPIVIQSASPLSKTQQEQIEKLFPKATISFEVEEHLIGGLRVQIGTQQIDLSIKEKLRQIHQELV